MNEVTIEMYRGIDPIDNMDRLFALDPVNNRVATSTYTGEDDPWSTPSGYATRLLNWGYATCSFYGGVEEVRKMQHLWTHTFTL